MKLAMSALMIVGLLFGGNATVAAAQDDLPHEPLYQIKLLSEDVNLWLTSDPVAQIEMLMQQTQTRTEEMAALTTKNITPPPDFAAQVQERIQRALHLTANLDEPSQIAVRQQIRERLQLQEQMMIQLQDGTCSACQPVLQQTRDMLRTQLRQMEGDVIQPEPFQNQIQNQTQNQLHTTQTPPVPGSTVTPQRVVNTPAGDGTGQQNGNGSSNPSAGTPMPQHNTTNQGDNGQQNGENNEGGQQNGENNGGGEQNGGGSGDDGGPMPGSGGQGGKP
ncbi:MAG TPA: DUF5667 domain-containing protein [Anaerolineales bacterium]|nr:DUF5667 domain-containing protein [Anaerolineales bacterium]